jgi:mannose-6-phosphate isomerase-like protein (cupin superfamily)
MISETRMEDAMRRKPALALLAFLGALACVEAAEVSGSRILAADEGDVLGNHRIKVDPQRGSMHMGVGLQRIKGGPGIALHRHDKEDEILFIHSGSGVGTVGDERRNITAGTTLYVPQGTWHGVDPQSDEMEILWIVSPPHFAEHLREIGAEISRNGKISSAEMDEIGRRHGFRDNRHFFLPRLGIIAATLGVAAVFVAFLGRVHLFRVAAVYAFGATLGTVVTIFAIAPGYLPPIVFAVAVIVVIVAVTLGATGGIGIRALGRRLSRGSFWATE